MARIRSVHPDICIDETLPDVSAEAERTFVRLWPHLDDDGRAKDHPKLLAAALYPLHDDMGTPEVERDLTELTNAGCLIRYEVDGKRYLSAKPKSWKHYQKPRHPTPSIFPPPPGYVPPTADGDSAPEDGPIGSESTQDGSSTAIVPDTAVALTPEWSGVGVGVGVGELPPNPQSCALGEPDASQPNHRKGSRSSGENHRALAAAAAEVEHARKVRDIAHRIGHERRAQQVHADEDEAREAFDSMYRSQPELAAAALAGWRESEVVAS